MKKNIYFLIFILLSVTATAQIQIGTASFYGTGFHGRPTASGEKYSQFALTAAHKTLPLGTVVKVTNTENNKSVYVKINDRGPFIKGRIIDLSTKAADILGYRNKGTALVKIEVMKADSIPADLLTTSAGIAKENGIQTYDSTTISRQIAVLDKVTDEAEKNDLSTLKETKKASAPAKELPQPAAEIKTTNDTGILQRSKYFVVTQLDKSKTGFYGLLLGVFSDPTLIFNLLEELEQYKQALLIQQDTIDGKTAYKLHIGKFQNRAYADALKLVLSDKFKEAVVLKYE